jgi:hypothetical protein
MTSNKNYLLGRSNLAITGPFINVWLSNQPKTRFQICNGFSTTQELTNFLKTVSHHWNYNVFELD